MDRATGKDTVQPTTSKYNFIKPLDAVKSRRKLPEELTSKKKTIMW